MATPRNCDVNIKAYTYDYGGISQCKFNIVNLFEGPTQQIEAEPQATLALPPTTPNKKPCRACYKTGETTSKHPETSTLTDSVILEEAPADLEAKKSSKEAIPSTQKLAF